MNSKVTIAIVLALIIVGGGIYFASTNKSGSYNTDTATSTDYGYPPSTQMDQGDSSISGLDTTQTTGTSGSTTKSYTMAEVSTHNSGSSCWTTISGKVYDVTSWISRHPGGQQAILSLCGKDGTSAFTNQHGGQARPANELASFYIGVLK